MNEAAINPIEYFLGLYLFLFLSGAGLAVWMIAKARKLLE